MRALAEEEAATCPLCGMPRAVCGNPDYQFAFEPKGRRCHATWAIAQHRDGQAETPETRATVWGAQLSEDRELTHPDLDELDIAPPTYSDS